MARLLEKYKTEIVSGLKEKLGRTNVNSIPKLQKSLSTWALARLSPTKTG